ncbi:hypothetical protein U0E10_23055 [Burkholderia ubonensis]|uniref:hypothetical protein n=1 Tax=Burkholderia ubonensis TaxID=101571 RepID=UPI002AB41BC5|nr:hypothetical protein [Burkholderia ubonensis]MDY7790775.1 hypothetical protein [Burkholderia ubonensis]
MDSPQPRWTVTGTDQDGNDVSAEIESFRQFTRLEQVAPERYSIVLLMSLFGGWKAGTVDPSKVVHEIMLLEKGEPSTLKPPIQNRHPPLKGLWHKHYLEQGIPSLAMNVKKGLSKYGMPFFKQKIAEAKAAGETRYLTADDIQMLAADVVHGNLERLREAEAMTGEWILFAKHESKNYYLDITTHDKSFHRQVRENIDAICCTEFPFLRELLANA